MQENSSVKGNDITIKSEFSSLNERFETVQKNLIDAAGDIKQIFSSDNLNEKGSDAEKELEEQKEKIKDAY